MTLARDICWFAFTWAVYRIVLVWPVGTPLNSLRWRSYLAMLPYGGMYAHSETWADFRRCVAWNAAGRPR
jgi:hypothetical protein